ncbi:hypothetical protein C8Q79DRAFT_995937 [Trametes meyenii]|nr:hypothetical protein C8Q79DRAFT_995937 [Trametes meyenii]
MDVIMLMLSMVSCPLVFPSCRKSCSSLHDLPKTSFAQVFWFDVPAISGRQATRSLSENYPSLAPYSGLNESYESRSGVAGFFPW